MWADWWWWVLTLAVTALCARQVAASQMAASLGVAYPQFWLNVTGFIEVLLIGAVFWFNGWRAGLLLVACVHCLWGPFVYYRASRPLDRQLKIQQEAERLHRHTDK